MVQPPTLKETKFLLPKPALMQNEVNPQQLVQMVQNNWPQIEALHSVEAKAQFLGEPYKFEKNNYEFKMKKKNLIIPTNHYLRLYSLIYINIFIYYYENPLSMVRSNRILFAQLMYTNKNLQIAIFSRRLKCT